MKKSDNIFNEILMKNFEKKRNNVAFVTEKSSITYNTFLERIDDSVGCYKSNGVSKGKRAVIFMENCPEFAVSFMALNICGAVIIPIYIKLGIEKLQDILMFYEPDYIITNELNCPNLFQARQLMKDFVTCIFIYEKEGNVRVDEINGRKTIIPIAEEVSVILSSSGTTSSPKGIMLTDYNIVSNTVSIAEYMGVNREDRVLMVKSINHSSSITGELLVGLFAGCTIYIFSGIVHARRIIESLKKNQITIFFAVPTMLNDIIRHTSAEECDIASLRIIHFYGAVMNDSDMEALLSRFSNCELIYSYGLTEASPRVTFALKDRLLKYKGTSGIAISDVSIRIDYKSDTEKYDGQGEIVIKGPNVMKGYFKNPMLTKKVLRNGELYTGDLGHLDMDGNLYVIGRKDNMIIKNGRNIFPEEIEGVITQTKEVAESLIVSKNEKIIAYVVPSEGQIIDDKRLIDFCRCRLEDYKVPDKIIKVVELKKNANNKVLRNIEY